MFQLGEVPVHSVRDASPVRHAVRVNSADNGKEALEGKGSRDVEFQVEGRGGAEGGRFGSGGRLEEFAAVVGFADAVGFRGGGEVGEEEDIEFRGGVGGEEGGGKEEGGELF